MIFYLIIFRCGQTSKAYDLFLYVTSFSKMKNDNNDLVFLSNKFNRNVYTKSLIEEFGSIFISESDIVPNIRTYNILLKGLQTMPQFSFDHCRSILKSMKLYEINPDQISINTMVDVCVRNNNLLQAEEVRIKISSFYKALIFMNLL